jgi:hypothetical protein
MKLLRSSSLSPRKKVWLKPPRSAVSWPLFQTSIYGRCSQVWTKTKPAFRQEDGSPYREKDSNVDLRSQLSKDNKKKILAHSGLALPQSWLRMDIVIVKLCAFFVLCKAEWKFLEKKRRDYPCEMWNMMSTVSLQYAYLRKINQTILFIYLLAQPDMSLGNDLFKI